MIGEDLSSEEDNSEEEVGLVSSAKGLTHEDISNLSAEEERIRRELEVEDTYGEPDLVAHILVESSRAKSYVQEVAEQEMFDAGVGSEWEDESR